jgi:hypothetical protein
MENLIEKIEFELNLIRAKLELELELCDLVSTCWECLDVPDFMEQGWNALRSGLTMVL